MKSLNIVLGLLVLTSMVSCSDNKPEVKENSNPFFTESTAPFGIPRFDLIKNEHYVPAIKEGIRIQNLLIDSIINNPAEADFENTLVALDASNIFLRNVQAVFDNMLSSNTSDSLQLLAKEIASLESKHKDDILMNEKLFKRVEQVYNKKDQLKLDSEQKILLDETYKNFIRGGAKLDNSSKEQLRKINEELSQLTLQFGDNILAETNKFQLVITKKEELAGLPQSLIDAAAQAATDKGMKDSWLFTLHNPSVLPFLQYSQNVELRKKMQMAYINRGNNNDEFDNKKLIEKIVKLRLQKARLLGYKNHAEFVLEKNMAKNPTNVMKLIQDVWTATLPVAKKEAETYAALMKKDNPSIPFTAADWRYYTEKVRKEKYNLDEEMTRPYFKLENVRKGIFDATQKLYGLTYKLLTDVPKYHPDAEVYEVLNEKNEHVAVLYMDYFPRESKRGGAWMDNFRQQYTFKGKDIRPIITVNCNFTKATSTTPSLLTWDEVTTLFHEFGHALHGMLSQCKYYTTSGTSVPRDFVELPSQVFENWAGEPELLKTYALHYQTGEVIPDELLDKMNATEFFNQGFAGAEYLAAAYLDMKWHSLEIDTITDVLAFETNALKELGLIPEIVSRYRSTYFNHIFSGGYSSGYYSYLWSEVLDADAFEAFKEEGIFNKTTANRFKNNILSKGYTAPADEMYRAFRGRDPKTDAVLKRKGLIK